MFPNPFKLIGAWLRHAFAKARGFETLAPSCVQQARFDKCSNCPLVSEDGFQCTVCSCLVLAKVSLAQEKCPVGKWSAVWILK